ncbi:MAG: hypothetical protein AB7G93_04550 [Bdellovibrionales bacterium]
METQAKEQKPKAKADVSAIRIDMSTQKLVSSLLAKANRKSHGRKVKASQLVQLALSKLDDADIRQLQERSLSNADRMEMKFREYCKRNSGATRDEFLGQLLEGKSDILEKQNVTNPESEKRA